MNTRNHLATFAALGLAMTLPLTAFADGQSASNPAPVGTWLLTVSFSSGNPPPFKEILTLHTGGTVTETNSALNGASGWLAPPALNLVGSDGQGTWQRLPQGKIGVSFSKMVFCGPAQNPFCGPGQEGQQLGYLVVNFKARISGDSLTVDPADSSTVLILGSDPTGPVIPFGSAASTGIRLH
jgi:hypothetical protein